MSALSSVATSSSDLIQLARTVTPDNRALLYSRIADLFQEEGRTFTNHERVLLIEILSRLTRQVEMAMRVSLAEKLAGQPKAPHDLILLLINDSIEVATPVILKSDALTDDDLIDLIEAKGTQHQLAVAARPHISEAVTGCLFDTGNARVFCALASNDTAHISPEVLAGMTEASRDFEPLQKSLLTRDDLPESLAGRMFEWVSDALKREITEKFRIDPHVLDRHLEASRNDIGAAEEAEQFRLRKLISLVDKLYTTGQLKPGYLVKSLREGQRDLFEIALSRLANCPLHKIQSIQTGKNALALALAIRAAGVDRSAFGTIGVGLLGKDTMAATPDQMKIQISEALKIEKTADARKDLLAILLD